MYTFHLFIDHKRLSFVHPSCVTLPNSVLLSIFRYNKDPSSGISVYTVKFFIHNKILNTMKLFLIPQIKNKCQLHQYVDNDVQINSMKKANKIYKE